MFSPPVHSIPQVSSLSYLFNILCPQQLCFIQRTVVYLADYATPFFSRDVVDRRFREDLDVKRVVVKLSQSCSNATPGPKGNAFEEKVNMTHDLDSIKSKPVLRTVLHFH